MTAFLKKFSLALVCGGGVVALFAILRVSEVEPLRCFCDAFSLAGVFLSCGAGLAFVREQGGFLGVGYLLKWVKTALFPFGGETRSAYERNGKECVKNKPYSVLAFFLSGVFYLGIACVLLLF